MASSQSTVDFIVEQIAAAGWSRSSATTGCASSRRPEGRAYLGACGEAPPYPRAKPHLVIAGKRWDDREWLPTLVRITAAQLPLPVRRGR